MFDQRNLSFAEASANALSALGVMQKLLGQARFERFAEIAATTTRPNAAAMLGGLRDRGRNRRCG